MPSRCISCGCHLQRLHAPSRQAAADAQKSVEEQARPPAAAASPRPSCTCTSCSCPTRCCVACSQEKIRREAWVAMLDDPEEGVAIDGMMAEHRQLMVEQCVADVKKLQALSPALSFPALFPLLSSSSLLSAHQTLSLFLSAVPAGRPHLPRRRAEQGARRLRALAPPPVLAKSDASARGARRILEAAAHAEEPEPHARPGCAGASRPHLATRAHP